MFSRNPDDELERLERLSQLGDAKAKEELKNLRISLGLCSEHGLSNCQECSKPLTLEWDDLKNTENRAAELQAEESELTDEEAWAIAGEDDVYSRSVWDELLTGLTSWMKDIHPNSNVWEVSGENLGWRRASGSKIVKAETGEELLRQILPKTDCSFTIYKWRDKNELKISNAHHDSSGEVYWIRPHKEQDEDNIEYRRNPDDLDELKQRLELASTPELRREYLELQVMYGQPIDISILKEEDLTNEGITGIIDQSYSRILFGNRHLRDLLPRFKNIIINKLEAHTFERPERIGDFQIDVDFDVVRIGWFPETKYEDAYFRVITRQLTDPTRDPFYYGFTIPYTFKDGELNFPFEHCYVCYLAKESYIPARFNGLDSFTLPVGITALEMTVSPPDYLSPEGNYGNAPYSEASIHYKAAGNPIIWYALYAENITIKSVGICVNKQSNYQFAGLERPSSLLSDEIIHNLTEYGRSDYNIKMPNFSLDLDGGPRSQGPAIKISGFRNVHVNCGPNKYHQFPYFMWRLPNNVYYYPLIGRSLDDLGHNFTGIKYKDGAIRGFDLGPI